MTLTSRLAVAMIALVAIAVSAVAWLSYRRLEQALLPRVLDRIETHSRLVAADVLSHVRGARADVIAFRASAAANGMMLARLNGGADPADHVPETVWRERLVTRLIAELGAKPAYSQFRFIGMEDGGREIVRVDRSGPNGAVRVVPDAELQRKGDRPYFKETIRLGTDEIYVSPLDLNQEGGVIETPYVPTLRVATPIAGPDGKPFGIIIVNVDMRPAFDRVRSAMWRGGGIFVVNQRGDYLVHPDPVREFGSQVGAATDWRNDFPELASASGATRGVAYIVADKAGQPGGAALAPAILFGKEWVGIIETVPNAVIMAPAAAIQRSSLLVGLFAVLSAAALAMLVDVEHLHAAADRSPQLRTTLVRHQQALFVQAQQAAICSAMHPVEARLSRWLLRTYDLSGSNRFRLTQELMARMIGAKRNSVSIEAHTLQQSNLIRYSRGQVEIIDLEALIQASCECYAAVKAQYERLLGPPQFSLFAKSSEAKPVKRTH